jgi:hypothetical protein
MEFLNVFAAEPGCNPLIVTNWRENEQKMRGFPRGLKLAVDLKAKDEQRFARPRADRVTIPEAHAQLLGNSSRILTYAFYVLDVDWFYGGGGVCLILRMGPPQIRHAPAGRAV